MPLKCFSIITCATIYARKKKQDSYSEPVMQKYTKKIFFTFRFNQPISGFNKPKY